MSEARNKKSRRQERGDSYRGREYRIVEASDASTLVIDGEQVAVESLDEQGNAWRSSRTYSWFPTLDELAQNIILVEDILSGAKAESDQTT
jgi:hypothetical protein